jgi:hypothetical protein
MMDHEWIGLALGFASALLANIAYSLEHDAAAALPPLSPRHPLQSARQLLGARRWLIAFGAETAGWLMYVAALRLAPLALVQAIGASGVGVLAFATARGHPSRLARREQFAVVLALGGLVLLALSVTGRQQLDHRPSAIGVIVWLAAAAGVAVFLMVQPTHSARAASLGLAAGLLLSDGDISAKLIGYRGPWLIALVSLIAAYSIGSIVLQSAYQRGDALTAAGTSTMVTSGVPIVAGFVLFGETLPHGIRAVAQVAAFACLVLSAVALENPQAPGGAEPAAPPLRGPQKAYYQRLAGRHSPVSSNGKLTLTATDLTFRSRIGRSVTVRLPEVRQAEEQPVRRFHLGGHHSQLVITTQSGRIGFLLADPGGWARAISGQLPAAGPAPGEG